MGVYQITLLITSILLMVDTLFSLVYFQTTYMVEIKRRYSNLEEIPDEYKKKLSDELFHQNGMLRTFIQSLYLLWFFLLIFSPLWFVPIIFSLLINFTNIFYRKAYIAPMALVFNLLLSIGVYVVALIFGIFY